MIPIRLGRKNGIVNTNGEELHPFPSGGKRKKGEEGKEDSCTEGWKRGGVHAVFISCWRKKKGRHVTSQSSSRRKKKMFPCRCRYGFWRTACLKGKPTKGCRRLSCRRSCERGEKKRRGPIACYCSAKRRKDDHAASLLLPSSSEKKERKGVCGGAAVPIVGEGKKKIRWPPAGICLRHPHLHLSKRERGTARCNLEK